MFKIENGNYLEKNSDKLKNKLTKENNTICIKELVWYIFKHTSNLHTCINIQALCLHHIKIYFFYVN